MTKKIIYSTITFVLMMLVLEIFTTILFYFKDVSQEIIAVSNVTDKPYLYYGFSLAENTYTKGVYQNRDGFASDVSVSPKTKFRVVLIGGSVAQGLGSVIDMETGKLLFEKDLSNALGKDVELVNAGIAGYTIQQQSLLYQLYLKKYKPDLIVDLSGYNDVISFKINRHIMTDEIIPPQSYRDFKVIEHNKLIKSAFYRVAGIFKNTIRTYQFVLNLAKGVNQYNYDQVTPIRLDSLADFYISTSFDIYSLAAANNSRYLLFLQPVKWYNARSPDYLLSNVEDKKLALLYHKIEERILQLPYAKSLTHIIDGSLQAYTDQCHFNYEGNQMLSNQLSSQIQLMLRDNTRNHKNSGYKP